MSAPLLAHEVEISDGLTLADLKTIEDCQLAVLTLARDINRIEEQLAGNQSNDQWAERAESALRFKKALRQVVNERVGAMRRAERAAAAATREHVILENVKLLWPAEFENAVAAARTSHPQLWDN